MVHDRRFVPTERGRVATAFLQGFYARWMDNGFPAPLKPLVLVTVHLAPERPLTHPQQPGHLLLCQPSLAPSPVGFL